MELSGEVFFDAEGPPPARTAVHLVVEDTTRADASSVEAARLTLIMPENFRDAALVFRLSVPHVDPALRYELRGHADVDGDGRISQGDQISMESTPVLTQGHPVQVALRLRRLG